MSKASYGVRNLLRGFAVCVSGCCRGRGCKEGAGGTLPPAVLVRKFVSGCAVRAEVRLWAGSQPLGSLALARFGRGYRQNENETNVRHSVRSETPKVRHSCVCDSYLEDVKKYGRRTRDASSRIVASHYRLFCKVCLFFASQVPSFLSPLALREV